jgi:spoIIIJ-associated protein
MMEDHAIEKRGKSVDEAIKAALDELGCEIDDVIIEVLEEANKGILGIVGKRPAVVKVTLREKPEEEVRKILVDLLDKMKIDYKIDRVEWDKEKVRINIVGKDMGLVIGRKGETLNALQYMTSLIVNKDREEKIRIVLDVEDYRRKKERSLEKLAIKLSDKVKSTQKNVVMRPMSPQERRYPTSKTALICCACRFCLDLELILSLIPGLWKMPLTMVWNLLVRYWPSSGMYRRLNGVVWFAVIYIGENSLLIFVRPVEWARKTSLSNPRRRYTGMIAKRVL